MSAARVLPVRPLSQASSMASQHSIARPRPPSLASPSRGPRRLTRAPLASQELSVAQGAVLLVSTDEPAPPTKTLLVIELLPPALSKTAPCSVAPMTLPWTVAPLMPPSR